MMLCTVFRYEPPSGGKPISVGSQVACIHKQSATKLVSTDPWLSAEMTRANGHVTRDT